MPTLDFKGKQFVYAHHLSVPFRELKIDAKKSLPAAGAKPDLDDNLIIHGDNLHALKALLPQYAGKIKCIYIDPPYNTGNEGEPPPINESISGVNPDKLWATLRRHINGTEAIHGGADYRAFAAG